LVLREARSSDIDALAKLEAESFDSDRLSRRSLAALAKSPSASILVARKASGCIGYAALLVRRGGRSARLYSIAVAADAAGRGVGAGLLRAAENEARRRGATRMRLEVRADNTTAIQFYERSGYRLTGNRPDYYEDGMTALLYSRELAIRATGDPPSRLLGRAA